MALAHVILLTCVSVLSRHWPETKKSNQEEKYGIPFSSFEKRNIKICLLVQEENENCEKSSQKSCVEKRRRNFKKRRRNFASWPSSLCWKFKKNLKAHSRDPILEMLPHLKRIVFIESISTSCMVCGEVGIFCHVWPVTLGSIRPRTYPPTWSPLGSRGIRSKSKLSNGPPALGLTCDARKRWAWLVFNWQHVIHHWKELYSAVLAVHIARQPGMCVWVRGSF